MTATVNVPQCSPKSFLDNVGSNNRNADPVKQILVQDAWLHSVNTIISARLRGGWVAGYLGPWQHQQHFRLEGPRDPPAASRQPLLSLKKSLKEVAAAAAVRGCAGLEICVAAPGARCLVPGAWCLVCRSDGLHVYTSTSSSLASRARVTFGMLCTIYGFPSPQSSFGSHYYRDKRCKFRCQN